MRLSKTLVLVATFLSSVASPSFADKMYWTQNYPNNCNKIRRASLDGSQVEDVLEFCGPAPPTLYRFGGVALDFEHGHIYWTAEHDLRRANIDGTSQEILHTLPLELQLHYIALDVIAGKLYWTTGGQNAVIQRANLDGSGAETVLSFPSGTSAAVIALDLCERRAYWVRASDPITRIETALMDSPVPWTSTVFPVNRSGGAYGLALDVGAGKVYWTESGGEVGDGKIRRASMNGFGAEDLIVERKGIIESPTNLDLDIAAGMMYWTDTGTGKIFRANMEIPAEESAAKRTDVQDIQSQALSYGIALDTNVWAAQDCNSNGLPDACEIASGTSPDCNTNGILDECDIAQGTSMDCNTNGCPDECELMPNIRFGETETFGITYKVAGPNDLIWRTSLPDGSSVPLDLNEDGRADLAWVSISTSTLSTVLGIGDGSFALETTYSLTGIGAISLVAGDFDHDAHIDIVVGYRADSTFTPRLEFFKNEGDGSGLLRSPTPIDMNVDTQHLLAADFNQDGRLDIINTSRIVTPPRVTAIENREDGSWNPVDFFTITGVTRAAVGDFDGDSWLDVAVTAYDAHTLYLLRNSGNGAFDSTLFQAAVSYDTGSFPSWVSAADMDNDDHLDLVVSNTGETAGEPAIVILWSNGNGTFEQPPSSYPGGPAPHPHAVADLDGDGDPDVAAGDTTVDPFILENKGGRTLIAAKNYSTGSGSPGHIAAEDFNEDGLIDLANGHWSELEILLNSFGPLSPDCNANAIPDECDIDEGTSQDCNANGTPDECQGYASMVLVPAGEYLMGDHFEQGFWYERPVHAVYVSAFFMDRYEVTNQAYAAGLNWALAHGGLITVGANGVVYGPSDSEPRRYCDTTSSSSYSRITWDGSAFAVVGAELPASDPGNKTTHPMVRVSWFGAAAYANWRSEMNGQQLVYGAIDARNWHCDFTVTGYRLPTEAEWEKACRGAEFNPYYVYPWGDDITGANANYANSGDLFEAFAIPGTAPVGYYNGSQIPPGPGMANGYGLYDMAGNAWEWCNDWLSLPYYGSSPYDNPQGPASGTYRVYRGGSWYNDIFEMRCARRQSYDVDGVVFDGGFRLVLRCPSTDPACGDCNTNSIPDECDIAFGTSTDCNTNGTPDECETGLRGFPDCNSNGIPDACDIQFGTSRDCQPNTTPDECELAGNDCDANSTPDECQPDCNTNGIADRCDIDFGTSRDECGVVGVPDECEIGPPGPPAAFIGAVTRKTHAGETGDIKILTSGRVQDCNVTTESRNAGIAHVRATFFSPPGGPGPCPIRLLWQAGCPCGYQAAYVPYTGASNWSADIQGNELILIFVPALENARTYKVEIGSEVSSIPGQSFEVRGLRGDVNHDGRVNAVDRSTVVGVWTGAGFTPATDISLDGRTDSTDRSIVVGVWTGTQNCAP